MEHKYPDPPKGLICPIITPLRQDDTLDSASFERLLEHIDQTVDGILLSDLIWGEGLLLPDRTRLELIASALEIIRGQLPIMVTITGPTLNHTAHFKAQAESLAASMAYQGDLFWVDYPIYYHSNRGLPQMYTELTRQTETAWLLGNLPDLVKMQKGPGRHKNIRTGILKKTVQNAAVKGIIFAGTLKRSLDYQKAVRFRSDFTFYDSDEAVFLKNPGTGGVVAGGSNFIPRVWLEITRSSLNRYDMENAYQRHQAAIWESGVMLHSLYALYKKAPAFYMKKILLKTGIIADDHTIRPEEAPDPMWHKDLDEFFDTYDIT